MENSQVREFPTLSMQLPSICLLHDHRECGEKCKTLRCSLENRTRNVLADVTLKSRRQVKGEWSPLVIHLPSGQRVQMPEECPPVVAGLTAWRAPFLGERIDSWTTHTRVFQKVRLSPDLIGEVGCEVGTSCIHIILLTSLNLHHFFKKWQVIGQTILASHPAQK